MKSVWDSRWVVVVALLLFIGGCGEEQLKRTAGLDPWADRASLPESTSSAQDAVIEVSSSSEDRAKRLYQSKTIVEGQSFINFLGMAMKWIPSGSFTMGRQESPERMKVSVNGTWPVRKVNVRRGFWMSTKEVTQEQYEELRGSNPSFFKGKKNPVDSVSWKEAVQFCGLLTEQQNEINLSGRYGARFSYQLPSEAQWEYACRAGTTTVFYGKDLPSIAWYFPNSKNKTHVVGEKLPNEWGLYDMLGNVEEWCLDHFVDTYDNAPSDERPRRDVRTVRRVLRGGSFASVYVKEISAAGRKGAGPSYRYNRVGFRPVMVLR